MKRLTVLFAVIFMAGIFAMNTQAQQETDINMSMTVDEYIEARPEINWDLGETYQSKGGERLFTESPEWDIAYANCPFTVSFQGDNDAGDGVPRFAREEEGPNAEGFDRLPSLYRIYILSNGVQYPDYQAMANAEEVTSMTREIDEAPHDGQVKMKMEVDINGNTSNSPIPQRKTKIDPNMTPEESADAGVYEASIVATFSAL